MEIKKENKSVFRIILGLIFFAISIGWIADKINDSQIISLFDWAFTGIFALNGLVHITQGLGFSFTKGVGK